jgi:hypothetical protein
MEGMGGKQEKYGPQKDRVPMNASEGAVCFL